MSIEAVVDLREMGCFWRGWDATFAQYSYSSSRVLKSLAELETATPPTMLYIYHIFWTNACNRALFSDAGWMKSRQKLTIQNTWVWKFSTFFKNFWLTLCSNAPLLHNFVKQASILKMTYLMDVLKNKTSLPLSINHLFSHHRIYVSYKRHQIFNYRMFGYIKSWQTRRANEEV